MLHVDRELVERVLDERPVVRETAHEHRAHRVEVDLVGVGSEVILALLEVIAEGDHRLAGRTELVDRRRNLLQLRETAPFEAADVEVERTDAVVVGSRLDGVNDVAQQRLGRLLVQRFRDGPLDRVAGQLLDDRSARVDDQRGLAGNERDGAREHGPDHAEEHEQQQEVQDLSQPVEAAPDPVQDSADCAKHGRSARCAMRRQGCRHAPGRLERQTFSSMRAALPVRSRR